MEKTDLVERFTYHPPTEDSIQKFPRIRAKALELATLINEEISIDSREKSLAITKLEECVMWANASIARNQSKNP